MLNTTRHKSWDEVDNSILLSYLYGSKHFLFFFGFASTHHLSYWLKFYICCSYIKDYDGGILMECKIDPKLPYTDISTMIRRQRQVRQSGAPLFDDFFAGSWE